MRGIYSSRSHATQLLKRYSSSFRISDCASSYQIVMCSIQRVIYRSLIRASYFRHITSGKQSSSRALRALLHQDFVFAAHQDIQKNSSSGRIFVTQAIDEQIGIWRYSKITEQHRLIRQLRYLQLMRQQHPVILFAMFSSCEAMGASLSSWSISNLRSQKDRFSSLGVLVLRTYVNKLAHS